MIVFLFAYDYIQLDDAYIFYTYAQNIAAGHGYTFNPGEHVSGVTSPLYTIILATTHALLPIISIPTLARIVGAISLLAIGIIAGDMISHISRSLAPLLFPILFIANPLLPNAIGMETYLVMALLIAALHSYSRQRYATTAIVLLFSIIGRPDALLFAGVLGIDYIVRARKLPPYVPSIIFTGGLIITALLHFGYFGTFVPTTLAAKIGQTSTGYWGGGLLFLRGLKNELAKTAGHYVFLLIACSGMGYTIWRRRDILIRPEISVLIIWSFAYIAVYGFILNPPAYAWYYTPLALVISLFAAILLGNIPKKVHLAVLVLAIIAAAGYIVYPKATADTGQKFTVYTTTAHWLNQTVPKGSSVAANEIGILGYHYTRGTIIDGLGLITPGVAEHAAHREFDWYIHAYEPDYLVFNDPPRRLLEDSVYEPWFQIQYKQVATIGTRQKSVGVYARRH